MLRSAVATATLLFAGSALAVPGTITDSDSDGDATITLTILDQSISDDETDGYDIRSFCRVRIQDNGGGDDFSSGDRIEIEIRENDVVGDEVVWSTSFDVSAAEVSANQVDRTFDCSSDFAYDGPGDSLEMYAWAKVEKDETCWVCSYDRPETGELDVATLEDDGREDNDAVAGATAVTAGRTNNFVANDADYLRLTTTGVNRVQVDVLHDPGAGVLLADAFAPDGSPIPATVTTARNPTLTTPFNNRDDRTTLVIDVVGEGDVLFRITPASPNDPNFYDVDISLTPVATECTPGETELLPCGNCGGAERVCDSTGNWGDAAECLNEGTCAQGAEETEACDGGAERTRTCGGDCEWEPFGECIGAACDPGDTVACYTGEPSTEEVGACVGGTRTCVDGTFSECVGEVTPVTEICGNGIDDDCDGYDDRRDDDCDTGLAMLGEPCDADSECDPRWTCLGDPDPDRFIDGYCGDDQTCTGEANECTADGLCADLGDSDYCLLACGDGIGCRFGYTCAELPEGDACIPRCRTNDDCFFEDAPTCNVGTGLCEGEGSGDTDNPGNNDNVADLRGCGCTSAPAPMMAWMLGLVALVGLGRRRA